MAEPFPRGRLSGTSIIDLGALAREMESLGAELQQNIISNLAVEIPADLHMPPALSGINILTCVFPPPNRQITNNHIIEYVKGLLAEKVLIAGNAREDDLVRCQQEFFYNLFLQPGPIAWVRALLHWREAASAESDVQLTPQDILSIAVFNMTSLQFIDCTITESPFLVANLLGDRPVETHMVRTIGRHTPPTLTDTSFQIDTQRGDNNRPQLKQACLRWNGEAALGEVKHAEPIMLHTSLETLELVGFSWVARQRRRGFQIVSSLLWMQVNPSITKLVLNGCLINDTGLEQVFDLLPSLKDLSIELACENRMWALFNPRTDRYRDASPTLKRDLGAVLRQKARGLRSLDLDATAYPSRDENRDDFFGLLIELENLEHLAISRADFFKENRVQIELEHELALPRRLKTLYVRYLRSDAEVHGPTGEDPPLEFRREPAQSMMNDCVALLGAMSHLSVTLKLTPKDPEPSIPDSLTRRIQRLEKYRACHGAMEGSQFATNLLDPSQVITISVPRLGE